LRRSVREGISAGSGSRGAEFRKRSGEGEEEFSRTKGIKMKK
jgi:hypothetical protein